MVRPNVHDEDRKHRHDTGHPDHAPESTVLVTKGIQLALGMAIAGTALLLIYMFASLG